MANFLELELQANFLELELRLKAHSGSQTIIPSFVGRNPLTCVHVVAVFVLRLVLHKISYRGYAVLYGFPARGTVTVPPHALPHIPRGPVRQT